MCWVCDGLAPTCDAAVVSDTAWYMSGGVCAPCEEENDEDLLEELAPAKKSCDAGTQCGLGLVEPEAAPQRAPPRERSIDQGTTTPSSKIRASIDLP